MKICAHRGCSYRYPDNILCSVVSFSLAKKVDEKTGYIERSEEYFCATEHFYFAKRGSLLRWKSKEYCYQIFRYSLETEEHLIYTYCYQREENWATYAPDISCLKWEIEDAVFQEDCYFRLVIKRCDGGLITALPNIEEVFQFCGAKQESYIWPLYFQEEAILTSNTVKKWRKWGDLSLILLTDTHYVNNGTWVDSAYNIARVAEKIKLDAVVHLGDITDGMISQDILKEYAGNVIEDLKKTGKPVYLCLGNHDSNYFYNNPEAMTEEEMSSYYLGRKKPYYYVDYERQKLRILYLHSFDYKEKVRYGFSKEEVDWVRDVLANMKKGWDVMIFSHVPPLPIVHFWSDEIRNGEELIQVLEEFHARKDHKVLAYIHGHNHAEQIYTKRAFPIIAIGCNKVEDFKDKKPEGAVTCDRKIGTVSQDLWDVLIISRKKNQLRFVRFGAGDDRIVEC